MRYTVNLTQEMSRTLEIDAKDKQDLESQIADELYFDVNITNNFEESGDVDVSSVEDENGRSIKLWND
jgi:hypothetical protein